MKEDKTISINKTMFIITVARFVERLYTMINNSLSIKSEDHETIRGFLEAGFSSNPEAINEDGNLSSLCVELKDLLSKVTIGKSCLLKAH